MPGIEVQPLEDEHLAAAERLLADRHARHRKAERLLPEVSDFRAQLERDLDHEAAAGVVALNGDEVVAYVIGRVEDDPRLGDRRAIVDFAGCAAAEGRGEAIRDLYAALAARWVAAGATRHLALIPASDEALADPWLRLAFGVQYVWAARETAAMKPVEADVRIRPGKRLDAVDAGGGGQFGRLHDHAVAGRERGEISRQTTMSPGTLANSVGSGLLMSYAAAADAGLG